MPKTRHGARVARVITYGKSSGTKWKRLNVCVIASSFLLLASVAILQLRLAIVGRFVYNESDGFSVNSSHDGWVWKENLWQEGGWGGQGKERGQRLRLKVGNKGSDIGVDRINSERIFSEEQDEVAEEDEEDRDDEMENEMDMEDGGDDLEGSGEGGDNGESQHHDSRGKRLQEVEHEKYGLVVSRQHLQDRKLIVEDGSGERKTSSSEEGLNMKGAAGMVSTRHSSAGTLDVLASEEGANFKADRFRGVFSSDDEPIDEETRERLEHMSNIEDVLMLKSAKKLDWGRIQDEQSLKKEEKPKFLSDPINPESNPLLQDPDSVPGGLTKNDRALRKAFKRAGFEAHSIFLNQNVHLLASSQNKQDDSKGETEDQNLTLVASEHHEQATEGRAMDESKSINKSNKEDSLKVDPEPTESIQSKRETSLMTLSGTPKKKEDHHRKEVKKAKKLRRKHDMRGWGMRHPGIFPELSFSNFMEEFLFDEKCSLRVFMAWMTPPWSFTVRHQRVLESLFYFHPTACVVVFSETIELDFFKGFTDERYRIATVTPVLEELLEDTPTDVFATILIEWRKVDLFYLHYTELLRLGALYKYGGIYLDFDMIILKPLTTLCNTLGSEVVENAQLRPNGAIMVFEKFRSIGLCGLQSISQYEYMVEFTATYDEMLRNWNGADLLDRVMKAQHDGNDRPHVKPPISFFPLSSASISRYFIAAGDDAAIAEEIQLFNQILSQSFAVHLWNSVTFNVIPERGSLVDKLMGKYCLYCTDIL